jgi:hypothetical protein
MPRSRRNNTRKKRQRGGDQKYLFINLNTHIEGLGNQLYTYSAGLTVQKKVKLPICIIRGQKEAHTTESYKHLFDGVFASDIGITEERINSAKKVLTNRKISRNAWKNSNIDFSPTNAQQDIVLPSYPLYQNYASIQSVIGDLKNMLIKNEFSKDKYKKYKDMIVSNKSAYMHVRRGDYVSLNMSLEEDYYMAALDKLEANKDIETIYIFSDDIGWCKEHNKDWEAHTKKKIVYDETQNELEVLYMMTLCMAGAILSPSTFGSMGAYMGVNLNNSSTIVYKSLPFDGDVQNNGYQYPDRWIGI